MRPASSKSLPALASSRVLRFQCAAPISGQARSRLGASHPATLSLPAQEPPCSKISASPEKSAFSPQAPC
jgi:hypothetical protein